MKKSTKILLGVAALATITGVALIALKKKKSMQLAGEKSNSPLPSKPRFPIQQGAGMGDKAYQLSDVKIIQKHLNKVAPSPLARLDVDGKFGAKTATMLDSVYKTKSVNEEMFNKFKSNV